METDFYALLGVPRDADEEQLKKAYRKLARQLHPDANPDDPEAEERFKQVTLAYEVLRDPERRRQYDTYGIDGIRGAAAGGPGGPFGGFGDVGLGDLFDAFFGGASPFGGRRAQAGPPAGPDIEADVLLDFEQAVFGAQVEVAVRLPVVCDVCDGSGAAEGSTPETCPTCQGQGQVRQVRQSILGQVVTTSACPTCQGVGVRITSPCSACHGEGRRTEHRSYTIEVPAGIDRGQTLRLTGKGGAGPRGGAAGDLYVRVDIRPHERFERHGYDLVHTMPVGFAQAALGTQVVLPTLDGEETVVIEPGTQTGKVVRFRGKGVPRVDGRGRGDLLVQLVIETPTKLTKEEEDLIRRFGELRGETVVEVDHGLLGKLKGAFK